MKGRSTQWVKRNLDLALFASVGAGFAGAAALRLGTYPVYETDESYILQVAYEILNRGKLALPMYRFLGGNIENVWHSFTPLYFVSLSGFLKLFGFGVPQGRAFNLIAAVGCLAMVYLIGRRLFN
jgi:4-amino-4-deoxy-L-arabinose transferase-like glycosyltransferase